MLEERRQLEPLAKTLFTQLVVAHPGGDPGDQHFRLHAVAPDDGNGHTLAFLEDRRKEVRGFDGLSSGAAGLVKGQLEHEFRCRRDAQLPSAARGQHVELLFEGLEDLVRIELQVVHHLRERVPFHLREREEDVFVGQQRVIAPSCLLDRTIDYALC